MPPRLFVSLNIRYSGRVQLFAGQQDRADFWWWVYCAMPVPRKGSQLLAMMVLVAIVAAQVAGLAHRGHCSEDPAGASYCPLCVLARTPWLAPPEPFQSLFFEPLSVAVGYAGELLFPVELPRVISPRAPPGFL